MSFSAWQEPSTEAPPGGAVLPGRPVPGEGTWPVLWEVLLRARWVERPLLCGQSRREPAPGKR